MLRTYASFPILRNSVSPEVCACSRLMDSVMEDEKYHGLVRRLPQLREQLRTHKAFTVFKIMIVIVLNYPPFSIRIYALGISRIASRRC